MYAYKVLYENSASCILIKAKLRHCTPKIYSLICEYRPLLFNKLIKNKCYIL